MSVPTMRVSVSGTAQRPVIRFEGCVDHSPMDVWHLRIARLAGPALKDEEVVCLLEQEKQSDSVITGSWEYGYKPIGFSLSPCASLQKGSSYIISAIGNSGVGSLTIGVDDKGGFQVQKALCNEKGG
jgi:hypothetical protein